MAFQKYRCGAKLSPISPRLNFAAYAKTTVLPALPKSFGHEDLFPPRTASNPYPIDMLANDHVGDCTIACGMHAVMLWNKTVGRTVKFTGLDATDDYTDAGEFIQKGSGYIPGKPDTDTGLDMAGLARYWQQVGLRDFKATRHKIVGFLEIDPRNLDHLYSSVYLFNVTPVVVALPPNAEEQFDRKVPWSDPAPVDSQQYHCIGLAGLNEQKVSSVMTWGAFQPVTENFLTDNLREAIAVITQENLINRKSPEGFDYEGLMADLAAFQ